VGTNIVSDAAPLTIRDDDVPTETVLFQDDFNTDTAANWTILFGAADPTILDYTANFGYDYGQVGFADPVIPPAPHSTDGSTLGLVMSVNKLDDAGASAGVNAYPNGQQFTGDYAIRFDMYLMQNGSAGTTENAIFGINHSGTKTNWYTDVAGAIPNGSEFDGIWASVVADASALPTDARARDYQLFSSPGVTLDSVYGPTLLTGREAPTLANVFHQPPWTSGGGAGSPGNTSTTPTPSWAQVELSQSNSVVTLTINSTNILTFTNTAGVSAGNIMLGYVDAYNSIGSGGGGLVVYDNLRVVRLGEGTPATEVRILTSTMSRTGDTVQFNFTAGAGEPTTGFKLYSAPAVTGPYAEDNTATITSLGGSNYRVTATSTDAMRFYQIRRAP
jgi:hypothetical protein